MFELNKLYNMDCMEGMRQCPDKYFDLAIVDPVYGGVTKGGYMKNQGFGGVAKHKDYDLSLWEQEKTGREYFRELFRVSKNQVIWGGQLLRRGNRYQLAVLDCLGQAAHLRPGFCRLRACMDFFQSGR